VVALILFVAILAAIILSIRLSRIEPVRILREE